MKSKRRPGDLIKVLSFEASPDTSRYCLIPKEIPEFGSLKDKTCCGSSPTRHCTSEPHDRLGLTSWAKTHSAEPTFIIMQPYWTRCKNKNTAGR